jgi:hypothetical protein
MCQKAGPLVSGTIRKLVNKGIHLLCLFSTYIKRRPCPVTLTRSKPQWSILAYFIYYLALELTRRILSCKYVGTICYHT